MMTVLVPNTRVTRAFDTSKIVLSGSLTYDEYKERAGFGNWRKGEERRGGGKTGGKERKGRWRKRRGWICEEGEQLNRVFDSDWPQRQNTAAADFYRLQPHLGI